MQTGIQTMATFIAVSCVWVLLLRIWDYERRKWRNKASFTDNGKYLINIQNLKFLYKAQTLDGEWVVGRVGHPHIICGGIGRNDKETETFFYSYNETEKTMLWKKSQTVTVKKWIRCIVITSTIMPLEDASRSGKQNENQKKAV